jgi:hypothetical protein
MTMSYSFLQLRDSTALPHRRLSPPPWRSHTPPSFDMQCFVKSVDSVTKSMCHPFRTNMHHMCHVCVMWKSEIVLFWIASEWATNQRGICDELRVRTRFCCHNPIVLHCTIVGRAIGEQRGYAIEISFGLVAHPKSMLCRPLLGGFRTYPFL